MKVSELSEYKKTTGNTGIGVWDMVIHEGNEKFIIVSLDYSEYAAINMISGIAWNFKTRAESAMNRNFTKSELEQILGDLDDWEVVE